MAGSNPIAGSEGVRTFTNCSDLAREAGIKGGNTVKSRYGEDYYKRIGKMGGDKIKAERGPKFFSEIGKRGGRGRKSQQ